MAEVTMLGAGLMASGFAQAMLRRGDRVTVWNRTLERARPLEGLGATLASGPAEAVAKAERVHISLSDDAAVDAVLERIRDAVRADAIVIDHTTVTPQGTAARAAWCAAHAIGFLHAPVFMSPKAAHDATGVMLVSVPRERFERAEPALAPMTADLWYVGERADKAAALKLFGNCLLLAITGGLADVFALARATDIDPVNAMELFSHFNPALTISYRGAAMARGDFTAAFELTMARKDVRLMVETAGADAALTVLPALAHRIDELIERGHGRDDVGVLAVDAFKMERSTG